MAVIITDEDLQRLTARFLLKAVRGEKETHKSQFPGAQFYRITHPDEPGHLMFEQWVGSDRKSRGQQLYYLYAKDGREPLWRMVVDYSWNPVEILQAGVEDKDLHYFLKECLVYGYGRDMVVNMPEMAQSELPHALSYCDTIDGNLRAFNGQRYVTLQRHQKHHAFMHHFYLGEVQGGTF